jgi:hypothetical protein
VAVLGSITVNELEILELDVSPTTSGVDAPIGSLGIVTDGSFLYLKTGATITDWSIIRPLLFEEFVFRITGANQTRTANTYANVTELTTGILQPGTYKFEVRALCQSTTTGTGLGLRVGAGTAVMGTTFGTWFIKQGGNGTTSYYQYDQTTATSNFNSTSAPVANADFSCAGEGIFTVTTAGTVAVQLRSENANAVSIRIGSIFFIKKIA